VPEFETAHNVACNRALKSSCDAVEVLRRGAAVILRDAPAQIRDAGIEALPQRYAVLPPDVAAVKSYIAARAA